jgi:hypothetical protein
MTFKNGVKKYMLNPTREMVGMPPYTLTNIHGQVCNSILLSTMQNLIWPGEQVATGIHIYQPHI